MNAMKAWVTRIAWKLRGRRYVRLQLKSSDAIDGILIGTIAGHYRLVNAQFLRSPGDLPAEEMLGETWIRKEEVFLLNVKSY